MQNNKDNDDRTDIILSYGKQYIDQDDMDAVNDVLRSDWLTQGPKKKELERKMCEYLGVKHAIAVSSGTAALHTACMAIGLQPGDEVITSAFTFAASANCVKYCGADVVFADIDLDTYNLDPMDIESKITSKTKAIICVDYAGVPCDLYRIKELCNKYGLILIEDAAHSFGSEYEHCMVGSIADITIFSFHPVKNITSGEGGLVTTNDKEIARNAELISSHGISKKSEEFEDINYIDNMSDWYYQQLFFGYNYRMNDMQAALLCSQLKKIDFFKDRRKYIVKYDEAFSHIDMIFTQVEPKNVDACRHLYTLRMNRDKYHISRNEFFLALKNENIQPQVHYIPVYLHPYYKKLGYKEGCCKNAEYVFENIISIPLFPAMTDEDVDRVINAVKKICCEMER